MDQDGGVDGVVDSIMRMRERKGNVLPMEGNSIRLDTRKKKHERT